MLFPIQSSHKKVDRWSLTNKSIKRYSKHIIEIKENKVILKTPKKLLKPSNHYYLNINSVNYFHAIIQILHMETQHERREETRPATKI